MRILKVLGASLLGAAVCSAVTARADEATDTALPCNSLCQFWLSLGSTTLEADQASPRPAAPIENLPAAAFEPSVSATKPGTAASMAERRGGDRSSLPAAQVRRAGALRLPPRQISPIRPANMTAASETPLLPRPMMVALPRPTPAKSQALPIRPVVVSTGLVRATSHSPVAPPPMMVHETVTARQPSALPDQSVKVDGAPTVAPAALDTQVRPGLRAIDETKPIETGPVQSAAAALPSERVQPNRSEMSAATSHTTPPDANGPLGNASRQPVSALNGEWPPPFDVIGALILKTPARHVGVSASDVPRL